MEFTLGLEAPFSLDYTLESGQVFRWERRGEWWLGVVSGGVVKIHHEGDTLRCVTSNDLLDSSFVREYFRFDEAFDEVLKSIAKDNLMEEAVQRFYGLRLIEQERWECLASFLLATNANIPRIRKMVASVCTTFGEVIEFEGAGHSAFPRPEALARAGVKELVSCGLGYRAPFLKRVAASVAGGKIDLAGLSELPYEQARKELLQELLGEKVLLGVGPKVADCFLLYSCGKDEAFPIDVWISRELQQSYPHLIPKKVARKLGAKSKSNLTLSEYDSVSKSMRAYFGEHAGYAQQYLFSLARSRGTA